MSTTDQVTEASTDFEEDPRYRIAVREMVIALVYWLAFTATVTGTAWFLGGNKNADELTFVLGFPAWFFWSVPMCCLGFSVIAFVLVKTFFTDIPLTADGGSDRQDEER